MQTRNIKYKNKLFLSLFISTIILGCNFTPVYIETSENRPIELKADFSGHYVAPVSNKKGADIYFKIFPDASNFNVKVNQNGNVANLISQIDHYLVYLIKNTSTTSYPSGGDPLGDKVVGPFTISAVGLSNKTVRFTNVPDSFGSAYYAAIRVQDSSNNDLLKDNNGLSTPWTGTTPTVTSKVAVSSGAGITVSSIFEINSTTPLSTQLRLVDAIGAKIEGEISSNQGNPTTSTLNIIGSTFNISTSVGNGIANFSGDNYPAVNSQINTPNKISSDSSGNIYIADTGNHRIRRIGAISGNIITGSGIGNIAYTGSFPPIGDGGPSGQALLISPEGVYAHLTGNVYIADTGNHRIRKINNSGIIETMAGDGTPSFAGDTLISTNARLNSPKDVKVDLLGNVYIADTGNHRIRKIDTSGIITTIAGSVSSGGFSGDGGQATNSRLNSPSSIEIDLLGNVYVADTGNHRIRKIDTSGIITTIAGNGTPSFSGDRGLATNATLNNPSCITFDTNGNLYISDSSNGRIRKVNEFGIITTIAGIGTGAYSGSNPPVGDGNSATLAKLSYPVGIVLDGQDNIYVSERDGNRVRKIN